MVENSYKKEVDGIVSALIPGRFRNFWKEYIKVFLVGIFAGILTHIYGLTNMLESEDYLFNNTSRSTVLGSLSGSESGRWLCGIINLTMGWYRSRVVEGILTILVIALAAVLLIDIFEIKSKAVRISLIILFETFSSMCALTTMFPYAFSFLLTVYAMYLVVKNTWQGLLGAVIVAWLAWSIFVPNVSSLFMMLIFYLIYMILIKQSENKLLRGYIKNGIMLVAFSGLVFYLVNLFIQKMVSVPTTSYQGAAEAVSGGYTRHFDQNILMSLFKTWKLSYEWMNMLPQLKFTLFISYAVLIVSIFYFWIIRKVYRNIIRTSLLILVGILIPFSLSCISLISYEFKYRPQHCMGYLILLSGALIFGEHFIETVKHQKTVFLIIALSTILQLYGFFVYDNIEYYNMSYVADTDRALCIRIVSALDQTDGFSYDKPVYFLDSYDLEYQKANTLLAADWNLYQNIWNSTTNLTGGDASYKTHIKVFEGVTLVSPSKEMIDEISSSPMAQESQKMKSGEFKIEEYKDTGVYVIVLHHTASPSWEFG